ncbi:MAG: hypothetical protein J2P23_04715, partial [Microlunatus sp.]|nr:hypothetical protein [Microlunatus sp.]
MIGSSRAAIAQWLHSVSSGRALLWLLMAVAAIFYSAFLGAFNQSPVEIGLVVAGLAGLVVLILTGQGEQPPRWTFVVAAALCVLGPVVSTSTNFTGWFLFGMGSVVVIGRPQAPYLLGALGWGTGAILMVALQVGRNPNTATLLWNSVAVIGVLLLAITRRQGTIRRRQEAELVERSRQLEQRSLELIEQTERTPP